MKSYIKPLNNICIVLSLAVFCIQSVFSVVTEEDIHNLKNIFATIQKENRRASAECDFLKQENANLWTEVKRIQSEIKDLQQYTRVDNVEIAGVPLRPNENIYEVLKNVCQALEISFDRDEISEAHRLPKGKQGHPFIVVRFISRRSRDKWLNASKSKQRNIQQVFPDVTPAPFYVNQHLTSFKKGLLDMAKRLVSEGNYAFAWVKDGKIYVRRTPNSEVIRIRTYEDFETQNGDAVTTEHMS